MAQTDASIFPIEFSKKKTDSQKIKPLFYISDQKIVPKTANTRLGLCELKSDPNI